MCSVAHAGQDELEAPAALQKVRCASWTCLARCADIAPEVVAPNVPVMLRTAACYIGDTTPAVVREQATQVRLEGCQRAASPSGHRTTFPPETLPILAHGATWRLQAFVGLAKVDVDAAWVLLAAAIRRAGPHSGSAAFPLPPPGGVQAEGLFPPLSRIFPEPRAVSLPGGLQQCSLARLLAMLDQVSKLPVRWHTQLAHAEE